MVMRVSEVVETRLDGVRRRKTRERGEILPKVCFNLHTKGAAKSAAVMREWVRAMDAERSPRTTYHFDRFTLNLAHGVLRAADETERPLRPKSFALLQLFVENAGQLLDRDSIMAAIWPDVFVTDDSITQCVGEIRRALGEAAPRLLRTLPRRGYRFTGEVVCADLMTGGASVQSPLAQERSEPPRPPGVGERRQLTVLFGDLVGSTALAEQLDPEDVGEVIGAYQRCCTTPIIRSGGHVARRLGDGVLAYFGYPQAQEDAAERAVRAGLAIVEVAHSLPPPVSRPRLQVRVGIATGLVVSDLAGGGGWEEVTVGKPLHLADRLQALAEPGTVVIAEGTRRLIGELFALENLGRHRLKGFSSPVQAWRVTGEGTAESRFEALRGASLASLIGRRQELRLLLDRWEQAKEGEGQLILLAGEAGIGKSRLVRALREELGREPHTVLSHHGSPQHTDTALYPVIGYLERASGLRREIVPDHQLKKLEALLASAPENVREDAWLLADLLEIPIQGRQPTLEPQQKKERTFQLLLGHVAGLAARRPVLAIFEDTHWADPTTLEFLGRLVDLLQRLPVLAIITFRPEFMPPWSVYGHATTFSLGRLGRQQTEAMIEQVAGGRTVPAAVREQILARTDGVPLFVEELTRMLLESGALQGKGDRYELQGPLPELAIPETLQDSLTARLDRLAPVKVVAQVAAVIGREFGYDLLAAAADLHDDDLRDALNQLIDAGLIFHRAEAPGASYSFKHALVRDAAYTGLVRARRHQLHARIAALLEEHFAQLAASQPEMLAHHWSEAANPEKATTYRLRAGVRALRRSATAEAVAQLAMGIEMLCQLPPTPERQRRELDLQIAFGAALVAARGPAASEPAAAYTRARELCGLLGEKQYLTRVLFGLWASHNVRDELDAAQAVATELLGLAKQGRQDPARILGYRTLGTTLLLQGDFTASRAAFERLLALDRRAAEAPDFPYPFDPWLTGQGYLSLSLHLLGHPEHAYAHSDRSLTGAREAGHHHTLALVLFCRCVLAQFCRDKRDLEAHTTTLQAIAAERGFAYWSAAGAVFRGWLLTQASDLPGGIAQMQAGLDAYRATNARAYGAYMQGLLAEALGRAGRTDEADMLLHEALAHVERTRSRAAEAELYRLQGQLQLSLPRPDEAAAEAFFLRALEVARHQKAGWWELRVATSLARLWTKGGKDQRAGNLLAPILDRFAYQSGMPDLEEAKELLLTTG